MLRIIPFALAAALAIPASAKAWVEEDIFSPHNLETVAVSIFNDADDGSPRQLMDDLQADVVEVEGPDLRKVKHALDGQSKILSTAQVGSRLRVLVDKSEPQPVDMLRGQLAAFADLSLTPQRPNLEDVFVSATRGPEQ